MPRWFEERQSGRSAAIAVPTENPPAVMTGRRAGMWFPERRSDCSGQRPAWFPFQSNVCDAELDPEDPDLTGRQRSTDPARW